MGVNDGFTTNPGGGLLIDYGGSNTALITHASLIRSRTTPHGTFTYQRAFKNETDDCAVDDKRGTFMTYTLFEKGTRAMASAGPRRTLSQTFTAETSTKPWCATLQRVATTALPTAVAIVHGVEVMVYNNVSPASMNC